MKTLQFFTLTTLTVLIITCTQKELRDAWFTKAQVEANTVRIEVITEGGFIELQ